MQSLGIVAVASGPSPDHPSQDDLLRTVKVAAPDDQTHEDVKLQSAVPRKIQDRLDQNPRMAQTKSSKWI